MHISPYLTTHTYTGVHVGSGEGQVREAPDHDGTERSEQTHLLDRDLSLQLPTVHPHRHGDGNRLVRLPDTTVHTGGRGLLESCE